MACVIWGGVINGDGYGVVNGRYAHRLAWEDAKGEIPDGLQIDHLCRNRACVNVAHLELVTQRTNILRGESPVAENARKTHCIHGHEFTPENTYLRSDRPNPARACRECMRRRDRERYARRITQSP